MTAPFNNFLSPQAPISGQANPTTANTTFTTSPTNTVLLLTAPAASAGVRAGGARITKITYLPLVTVAASYNAQLFRSSDSGTTKSLFAMRLYSGTWTANGTTVPVTTDNASSFGYSDENPLILQPSERLYCAVGSSLSTMFDCEGFSY